MKTNKIFAMTMAAAMAFSAASSLIAYADDSAAEKDADKTINATIDTVYKASELCPDGASYLKPITSWTEVNEANYESFGVDFGTIDADTYPSYATGGLNAELNVNITDDGTYLLSLLTVISSWWLYPAVYVDGELVYNGTDGNTSNKSELANTIATFNDSNNTAIAKVKLSGLEEGEHKIRITSGGSYEGIAGLVAVKLSLFSKSTFTTDDVIKAENLTRGTNRTTYITKTDSGFTSTENYTGEIAEVFGNDVAALGDSYLEYTDDTSTFNLKVNTAGKYKIYVLGENTPHTKLTFTDKNGEKESITVNTDWTTEYGRDSLFTATRNGDAHNLYVQACEAELDKGTYIVSVAPNDERYFTNFAALGMKLEEAKTEENETPETTETTVTAEQISARDDLEGPNAASYMASFNGFTGTLNTLAWTINKADEAVTKSVPEVELGGTVISDKTDIVVGLVITTEEKLDTIGTVTATLK